MSTHLDENKLHHIHLQADCCRELQEQVNKNTTALEQLSGCVSAVETCMTSVEDLQGALKQRLEVMDNTQTGSLTPTHWGSWTPMSMQEQLTELASVVNGIERKVIESEIRRTTKSVTSGCHSLPHNSQQLDTIHTKVAELDHGLDRCLSSCLDQELRVQLLERATYDGVLLWKIDDIERRRKEAIDGVTMSLYSIPFYTSRHGYKMCARVYLNGDGMGKGTHLSVFFVVMKGPFDALLPWPFKQKVTLTIINQAGKKHVTDTFRPDPQSSSFQRPSVKEMNVASGCPMFIRQEHLLNGGFVKDDCIFLQVVVDVLDLAPSIPL